MTRECPMSNDGWDGYSSLADQLLKPEFNAEGAESYAEVAEAGKGFHKRPGVGRGGIGLCGSLRPLRCNHAICSQVARIFRKRAEPRNTRNTRKSDHGLLPFSVFSVFRGLPCPPVAAGRAALTFAASALSLARTLQSCRPNTSLRFTSTDRIPAASP